MILFLDSVSPLPEFSIIEDNKIIFSKEIMRNSNEKMSDNIIPTYIDLEKKFSLSKKLKCMIINTGPGSYTALRVGIAFLAGLSLSTNIELKGISCVNLFKYSLKKDDFKSTTILIKSSNNQNFLCFFDQKKYIYQICKIEKNLANIDIDELKSTKFITNVKLSEAEMKFLDISKYKEFKFKELVSKNVNNILNISHQDIIEPIYISNNEILK